MLTMKNRLLRAMNRQEVDRPPCICPGGMMNMVTRDMMTNIGVGWPDAHTNPKLMARLATAACESGCFENYGLPFCMTVEVEGMGAKVDMGSMIYEPHVVGYAINSVEEWASLPALDVHSGRAKVVLDAIRILKEKNDGIPIIGNLTGPISVASSLMEPTTYYKELRRKREAACAYMDFVCQHIIAFGLEQLKAGVDIIAISDPSGTGEILGPKLFDDYVVPYMNRIIRAFKSAYPSCEVIVHICGQMRNVYEPLSRIDCNTVSFDALVSLREARENLPGKVLMGNVSTYALEFADPDKVRSITLSCLRAGSDIVAPACGLGNNSPIANLQAILETVQAAGSDI